MKITDIRAVYPNSGRPLSSWRGEFWQIIVRVDTDTGAHGWGYGGGGSAAVSIVERHLCHHLRGRSVDSPEQIAAIWDDLYLESTPYGRRGLAILALSGVDLALWDCLARSEGRRVCDLLSEAPLAQVIAYATGSDLSLFRDRGYTATKASLRPDRGDDEMVERSQAWVMEARRVMGAETRLMIDAYMGWSAVLAQRVADPLRDELFFVEDVLLPDLVEELSILRPQLHPVQLAGGEHDVTDYAFAELERHRALDIWQPDVTWCGGITAALRIARRAQAAGVPVCWHRGGEVWGLHLIAAGYGMNLAEFHEASRVPESLLFEGEPLVSEGVLNMPESAGFGVRPRHPL
ncbi:MAG: enolase C-terminal domain-like protein [Candidatus Latescibacterota bacterium]|nr:enolase C-terminal domain-like protein [Candidatus Latescibacterota bacterium]